MLLFLFSFYLNCYLFNCDEHKNHAKFNESLIIDKHHKNLQKVNAFLKNVQSKIHEKPVLIKGNYKNGATRGEEFIYDNITKWRRSKAPGTDQTDQNLKAHKKLPAEFHPSPKYDPFVDPQGGYHHWLPPGLPSFKVPISPLVIPRPLLPKSMALFPLENLAQRPELSYPGYLLRPVHSRYPGLLPRFHRYQNIYLRPPGPYLSNPSYTPGPGRPKRVPFLYAVNHYLQKNPHLMNPIRPNVSPQTDSAVSSKTPPPVTIPSSTISTTTISHNAKIWLEEIAPYTPVNEKTNNPSEDQSPPHHSENANEMSETRDYWFSTGTANTGQLFNEDEHGFLTVTLPEKDGISDQIPNDPNKIWMSTTAGDVLHGKITVQKPSSPSPKQRYLELMEQLDEGYMMVFIIELCRMIALKDRLEVLQVLSHTETIYNRLWNRGRLAWIGDPLETVIWKLSRIMSDGDIDLIRTYASMAFHLLLQRKQSLSAEVNSIIDETDLFYDHDEGNRLLNSLKQFEEYPKTTINGFWLCDSLIESFLLPFRRLTGTRRRQRLVDSINKLLRQRFPLLLRGHHKGTLAASSKPESQQKKRKRKRHHLPYKRKRKRKKQLIPEYNNENIYRKQFSQATDYKNLILRTRRPVTSDQPRLSARKSYRKNF